MGGGGAMSGGAGDANQQTVYVLGADGKLAPVRIHTGITDGTYTEVLGGELALGAPVVVGAAQKTIQSMNAPPGMGMGGGPRPGGGGGGGRR
jgi:HlyD family secretion protein